MWIPKDDNNDPYNRTNSGAPKDVSIGAGAGGGAPLGAGEGNQTNSNPSTLAPVNQTPQQKPATVQDYLGANKAQGNQLGEQFNTTLTQKANTDKSTIDSSANAVKGQAANATVNYNADLVNTAKSNPVAVANNQTITPTTTTNVPTGWGSTKPVTTPTGPAKSYNLNDFLKQWNASYAGPQSFETTADYNNAAKAASDATTKAEELKDAGGRKQILQDEFGVYGQGNKGLDQTLLQNSDKFGETQQLGNKFASLNDYFANTAKDVNAATQKAADTTAATKKNTQDTFADSLTGFQTDLNSKVEATKKLADTDVSGIKTALASGDATKVNSIIDKSTMTPAEKADVKKYLQIMNGAYGAKPDLNNYYTYNPATDVNAATVASKDDYAKAKALQKLTGVDYSGVLNPADEAKAGTWNSSTSGMQGASLSQYLKGSVGQLDKELTAKGSTADIASKLGMKDISQNMGDVTLGQKSAQAIIDAAKRTGEKAMFTPNGETATNGLGQLLQNATRQLVLAANGGNSQGGGGPGLNAPQLAGLRSFVAALYPALTGRPSPY